MKTDAILLAYERFCRLVTEERLYIDPAFSFPAACRWLGQLDSNQRDDGVKVRCLTAWLWPKMQ